MLFLTHMLILWFEMSSSSTSNNTMQTHGRTILCYPLLLGQWIMNIRQRTVLLLLPMQLVHALLSVAAVERVILMLHGNVQTVRTGTVLKSIAGSGQPGIILGFSIN